MDAYTVCVIGLFCFMLGMGAAYLSVWPSSEE
jgi:hypothetical protein